MSENVYELTLFDGERGYNFLVFGSMRINSLVEYSDEEDVKKLRNLVENPESYKGKINVRWKVRNNDALKPSQLELMSAKEVRKLVGVDFIAYQNKLAKFRDSEEDLLRAVKESL